MNDAGLAVSGLTVTTRRQRVPVVQDVSFEIAQGHVLGLVGESGSGKSTIGVALLGLARRGLCIDSGSVLVDGTDILTLAPPKLRRARGRLVAYVPQDPASGLNPGRRIGWQIREALTVHPGALGDGQTVDDRVQQVLREVNLPGTGRLLRSYPHQLSGGQQQRVAIAMAFACRPRVIVLDEPTTGLDVTTQRHVLDTVKSLTEQYGATAVYVSHDLAVVAQLADRTAVLYAGRLVEQGPTTALFRSARHPYTTGLIKAAPSPDHSTVLVGIEGRPPRPGQWPRGCAFADRCPSAEPDCRETVPPITSVAPGHQVRCVRPEPERTGDAAPGAVPAVAPRPGASLSVRGLVADYAGTRVLNGIDVSVRPGHCTAIVGESGSGKTTLARCLIGLHRSWSGEVCFGDEPLTPGRRPPDLRRRLQYVFQNPYGSLNPRQSVGQNLEEPLRYFTSLSRAGRRAKVEATLAAVALSPDFYDRMPDQLSGGERQRVAVGRALAVDPELLICDEITSALDVSVQAVLVEQLRRLQIDRGLSMVFITHNLAVVRSIAQDVVVLADGAVVEQGPVDEILDRPSSPYTRRLLRDLPRLKGLTRK
jgi:peptide/nickel transport system ATP-binding protein